MYKTITFLIFASILLFSCNSKKGRVLSKEEMENVLYEIQLAHAVSNDFSLKLSKPEQKDSLINDILYKYNITQADLDTSLIWYADNMNEYKDINDEIVVRLKKKRDELASILTSRRSNTDNNKVIPEYSNLEYVVPIFSFDIDSTKIKTLDLSSFSWCFNVLGISPEDSVVASAIFTYTDSLVEKIEWLNHDNLYSFNKPELPDSLLKNISGYVRIVHCHESAGLLLYDMHYTNSVVEHKSKALPMHQLVDETSIMVK